MKLIQRIEIITEVTEEELKNLDLNEYKHDLYNHIRSEADENASIKVEVSIEK